MTKLIFKAVRTVYFENDKKKVTTKKYETYKQTKAYAKRYSKLVNGARFVEVEVKFDTDSFKFRNVDIFVADSNGFENEHLEEIEKFQKETEEQNVKYTVSRFACSPEKEFDTVDEARLFAEECAKNYGFVYTINKVQGTTAQVIEEIEPPEKDYRASEQKQAMEVKPDEQTTEEKEYIFFSPKTGRYAARRFRGTEEAVIADTERRIEERDYARDFCLVIREVISKGKSKFIKAINWNDDYRIACGWYSEIVYSKEEAMKKAEELANKEKKAVNVYVTYLNSNGHAVEEQIDTVEPNKDKYIVEAIA